MVKLLCSDVYYNIEYYLETAGHLSLIHICKMHNLVTYSQNILLHLRCVVVSPNPMRLNSSHLMKGLIGKRKNVLDILVIIATFLSLQISLFKLNDYRTYDYNFIVLKQK